MKTVREVESALRERYSGKIEEIRGYSYIPWDSSAAVMNEIFGPMSWSNTIVSIRESADGSGYESVIRVSIEAYDELTERVVMVTRDGAGYADINTTNAGKPLRDTAYKASASDGTSRALKALGDALGLFLYSKEEKAAAASSSSSGNVSNYTPRPASPSGRGPSEKQLGALRKNNVPEAILSKIDGATASRMLGMFINDGLKTAQVLQAVGLGASQPEGRRSALQDLDDDEI